MEIADKQNITEDQAFLIYGHSLILGRGPASFDIDDNVDGGQDKQIDAFTIEESDGRADIYITQVTTTNSFSSTKLVQLGSGLRWIFEVSRKEIDKLPNLSLRDKIIQFREVQSELGPANIAVHVNFIANAELKPWLHSLSVGAPYRTVACWHLWQCWTTNQPFLRLKIQRSNEFSTHNHALVIQPIPLVETTSTSDKV